MIKSFVGKTLYSKKSFSIWAVQTLEGPTYTVEYFDSHRSAVRALGTTRFRGGFIQEIEVWKNTHDKEEGESW